MHQTILSQRKAIAINKLIQASEAISRHLELDPALGQAFRPVAIRDTQVKEMMLWEAAAELMFQLGIVSGAIQEGVTAVTKPAPPIDESQTQPPVDDPAAEDDSDEPGQPFDLDPETPAAKAVPVEEDTSTPEPEEPPAEAKPARKTTKRKSKK